MTPAERERPLRDGIALREGARHAARRPSARAASGRRRLRGLRAERAQRAGHRRRSSARERTIGCFVNFGADYLEPGVVHYGGRGAVVVGEIDGTHRRRASRSCTRCCAVRAAPMLTDNIWGYLWGKLIYGALLFATALTNESIADCFAGVALPLVFTRWRARSSRWRWRRREAGGVRRLRSARLPARRVAGARPSAPSTSWSPTTAARPRRIAASGATSPSASGGPRCDAQLGRSSRRPPSAAWPRRSRPALVALIHEIEDGQRRPGTALLDELERNPAVRAAAA